MNPPSSSPPVSQERAIKAASGWLFLALEFALLACAVLLVAYGASHDPSAATGDFPRWQMAHQPARNPAVAFAGVLLVPLALFGLAGFFTLQPNGAAVLVLFGSYKGTVRQSGFFWANPFYRKFKISLRARSLNGEKLKVNDKRGNPIEIAAVIVWRVRDTAQAMFDVDDYQRYVSIQSESAVRHVATSYAYDDADHSEPTLRGDADAVSETLLRELQERLGKAGVQVEETRLTHLAYAPEIAQAMLRRQQAEAVIAARQKIVHGAVSMVEMALNELSEKKVVQLDEERRAAMVSNLLVVLCGESEAHPVINTGTLYN
jgi:nucleotide-binding universal stress UspA family protein